jgi:hypothetical protein
VIEDHVPGYNEIMKGEFEMYCEEKHQEEVRESDLWVDYKSRLVDPYEQEAEINESFARWANDMEEANDYYNG